MFTRACERMRSKERARKRWADCVLMGVHRACEISFAVWEEMQKRGGKDSMGGQHTGRLVEAVAEEGAE
eukprot:5729997-Pleurochrysis_carterae.AAC.1